MKTSFIVIIFLVVGGFIISNKLGLDLNEGDDQKVFIKTFGRWVLEVGKNAKDVAGYAVKEHDWLPEINETNKTGDEYGS